MEYLVKFAKAVIQIEKSQLKQTKLNKWKYWVLEMLL